MGGRGRRGGHKRLGEIQKTAEMRERQREREKREDLNSGGHFFKKAIKVQFSGLLGGIKPTNACVSLQVVPISSQSESVWQLTP